MKKIIATVLAMVMALALCATAFAATAYTGYDNKGNNLGKDFTAESVKAESNKKVNAGTIAHYYVTGTNAEAAYYVAADSSSYDLKLTTPGKAPLYLSELGDDQADYKYAYKATEFKAIGEKCGQLDLDEGVKGYVVTDVENDDATLYFKAVKNGSVNLLVNGEIVKAESAKDDLVKHDWVANSYDKNDKVDSYKCKICGTIAKVYPTVEAAEKAGAKMTDTWNDQLIGWNYNVPNAGTTTTTNGSPKTFDAGIAMYAGMALMSVAGSAVVIGKKKEF